MAFYSALEIPGSPIATYRDGEGEVIRTFMVRGDLHYFLHDYLGTSYLSTDATAFSTGVPGALGIPGDWDYQRGLPLADDFFLDTPLRTGPTGGRLYEADNDLVQNPYIVRVPPRACILQSDGEVEEPQKPVWDVEDQEEQTNPFRIKNNWLYAQEVVGLKAEHPHAAGHKYDHYKVSLLYRRKSYKTLSDQQVYDLDDEPGIDDRGYPCDINIQLLNESSNRHIKLLRQFTLFVLPAARYYQYQFGRLYYLGEGDLQGRIAAGNTQKLVISSEILLTWHAVPYRLRQDRRLQRYVGTVNKYFVNNYRPGTLRFDGFASHSYRDALGSWLVDYTLKWNRLTWHRAAPGPFISIDDGHNFFFKHEATPSELDLGLKTAEVCAASGKPLYPYADWSFLFLPYDEVNPIGG